MSNCRGLLYASVALLISSSLVNAAECNSAQPRKDGDPSGKEISDAARGPDNKILKDICKGGFPPGSNTVSTWNTASIIYNVTRIDPNQNLQYCEGAFDDIIKQCISGDNFWGGEWKKDNEIYAIYDHGWPSHVLPQDLISSTTAAPAGATTITTQVDGSAITQTYVPTTISGKSSTTSSTTIAGVIVPLIIGAGGVAWIPFIPVGGAPPAVITPPGIPGNPNDPNNPTTNNSPTSTSTTSSSSSSSSSSLRPPKPDDLLFVNGKGTFDPNAATKTTHFGAATTSSSTTTSASSTTSTSTPESTPTPTQDPGPTPQQQCHDRCAKKSPIDNWCIANCGCYFSAAGC